MSPSPQRYRTYWKKQPPHPCACGCNKLTQRKWAPGHNPKQHHIDGHAGRRIQFTDEELARHRKEYNEKTRNVQEFKSRLRAWTLIKRYGITEKEYAEIFTSQGEKCALCGLPGIYGRLFVDHDHETGRVRGLLCPGCNGALGGYEKVLRYPSLQAYLKGEV